MHLSVVQTLPSKHNLGSPETHFELEHLSPLVQELPSEHVLLFATWTHAPLLQLSLVQTLPSLQFLGWPEMHLPELQ